VVKNEITYLAFPAPADAIAIWAAATRSPCSNRWPGWPTPTSFTGALLAQRTQWVTEPSPSTVELDFLDTEETTLYRDLIADAFGSSVRLEQERVSFAAIEQAVARHAGRNTHLVAR
jgi:hypothetical protein